MRLSETLRAPLRSRWPEQEARVAGQSVYFGGGSNREACAGAAGDAEACDVERALGSAGQDRPLGCWRELVAKLELVWVTRPGAEAARVVRPKNRGSGHAFVALAAHRYGRGTGGHRSPTQAQHQERSKQRNKSR